MEPGRLQITFDCLDPARVGTFWAAAFAYPAPDVKGWHSFLRSQGRSEEDLNAAFATVRHRTKFTKGPGSRAAGLAMAFKLVEAAQDCWRAVNAPHRSAAACNA